MAPPTGSIPARIYGLGKMLTNRLNHLRTDPDTVKNTFGFVKKNTLSKYVDKTMVSFDVKSLFTNVSNPGR